MVARFGAANVFMDIEMKPGVDFVAEITEAVAACRVLIVVMGPSWATVKDEEGKVRLEDPEDFVRLEVETALRRPDVTPIPVLVGGARMADPDDLPPDLRPITRRNALNLTDYRWHDGVDRLMETLDGLIAGGGEEAAPSRWRRIVDGIRSRRFWIAVGAVLILAALGALALLRAGSEGEWTRVDTAAAVFGGDGQQTILGLEELPQGAIAVGESSGSASVWRSDGSSWTGEDLGADRGAVWDVVSAGETLLAVGSSRQDEAFWRRAPGGPWKPAACSGCGGQRQQVAFAAIALGGGRFVAVGRDRRPDGYDAAVWRSSDRGATWERVADDPALGGAGDQVMKDVVLSNRGLLAVGRDDKSAAVWTSPDGVAWSRERGSESAFAAPPASLEMNSVTTRGTTIVAVGYEHAGPNEPYAAAVWVSDNEGEWRRRGDFAPRRQQMLDVAAAPPGFVAVGYDEGAAAVWTSTDGETWTRAFASDRQGEMESVASAGEGTLLGGGNEGGDAALWESKSPD